MFGVSGLVFSFQFSVFRKSGTADAIPSRQRGPINFSRLRFARISASPRPRVPASPRPRVSASPRPRPLILKTERGASLAMKYLSDNGLRF